MIRIKRGNKDLVTLYDDNVCFKETIDGIMIEGDKFSFRFVDNNMPLSTKRYIEQMTERLRGKDIDIQLTNYSRPVVLKA